MSGQQKKAFSKNQNKQRSSVKTIGKSWVIVILVLTVLFSYTPVFHADFVNWDDEDYVLNNTAIKSFSNIYEILTKPVQGNYHPLTMLSLAFNYSISGKDATSYHILNLLLHILNTVLVFFFVRSLSGGKVWMAFSAALLFGIHPLHVESVAWVSERKDLLYSLFFIAAMILYLRFLDSKRYILLALVFVLFLLSILSKPAAIIFPVVLLSLDYYKSRLNLVRTYIEKIPFFVVSLVMGLLTLQGQADTGARGFAEVFDLSERLLFACYGIMTYITKSILPFDLCAFYPFPDASKSLPTGYYLAAGFTLLLLLAFIWTLRKNKLFAFSILFYVINLALVLQILPVGNAVIADRYAYLPMLGVLMIPGFYFQSWMERKNGSFQFTPIILLVIITCVLMVLTHRQAATWKNGESLWDHAIKVEPSSRAFVLRGLLYKKAGNNDKAFECYTNAIDLGIKEPDAWVNRGNIYFSRKMFDKAIADYTYCISLTPKHIKAYENRGAAYASIGKLDLALADLNTALKLDSLSLNGYANRAMLLMNMQRYQDALADLNRYFSLTATPAAENWSLAGDANFNVGNYPEALNCYTNALKIREDGLYYFNRSKIYNVLGKKPEAYQDALKAINLGLNLDPLYLKSLQ